MSYWACRIAGITIMMACAWDLPIGQYLGVFAGASLMEASLWFKKSA